MKDVLKRKGTWHCFCKNMMAKKGVTVTKNYQFKNYTVTGKDLDK